MKTIIQAKNIFFAYEAEHLILEDVNFTAYEKDFLGLIGPNGGGKTTFLKIILGLLEPQKGTIRVFGTSPKKSRDQIGYVPQYAKINLDFPIQVQEAVLLGRLGYKKFGTSYNRKDLKICEEVLESLGLSSLKNKPIKALSGGQRQRVLIARALVRKPKLLLLDEPTNNVDPKSGKNFYDMLSELNKKITIILISHDLVAISKHINHVCCLNRKLICHTHAGVCEKIIKHYNFDTRPLNHLLHTH